MQPLWRASLQGGKKEEREEEGCQEEKGRLRACCLRAGIG